MNGGKETGASLGRNKTAQFSLTECLSNYLTQWKRSQSIIAKYLWNKMYGSVGTWPAACAPAKASLALTWQELQMGQQMADQKPRWALGSSGRQTAAELQGIIHALTDMGYWAQGHRNAAGEPHLAALQWVLQADSTVTVHIRKLIIHHYWPKHCTVQIHINHTQTV